MPKPDLYQIAEHVCQTAGNRMHRTGYEAVLCAIITRNALDRVAAALDRNTAAITQSEKEKSTNLKKEKTNQSKKELSVIRRVI